MRFCLNFSAQNLRYTFCTRLCEKETNLKGYPIGYGGIKTSDYDGHLCRSNRTEKTRIVWTIGCNTGCFLISEEGLFTEYFFWQQNSSKDSKLSIKYTEVMRWDHEGCTLNIRESHKTVIVKHHVLLWISSNKVPDEPIIKAKFSSIWHNKTSDTQLNILNYSISYSTRKSDPYIIIRQTVY